MHKEFLTRLENPAYLVELARKTALMANDATTNVAANSDLEDEPPVIAFVVSPTNGERYTTLKLDHDKLKKGDSIIEIHEDGSSFNTVWGGAVTGSELGYVLAESCLYASDVCVDSIIEFANYPDIEAREVFREEWIKFYLEVCFDF